MLSKPGLRLCHPSSDGICALFCALLCCLLLGAAPSLCSSEQDENVVPWQEASTPSFMNDVAVDPDRFPYMCSLRERSSLEHKCGGTLIDDLWVVTAARCVDPDQDDSVGLQPVVYCGIYASDVEGQDDKSFNAVATMHESWTGDVFEGYDIAMLKLDRPADLKHPVRDLGGSVFKAGSAFRALRWGETSDRLMSEKLQITKELPYITPGRCSVDWDQSFVGEILLCAGFDESDTCNGDSGGPLLEVSSLYGDIRKGMPQNDMIVGITSFGVEDCQSNKPGVYTRIGHFVDWIDRVIQEDKAAIMVMMGAIQKDDGLTAEAILLKGLDVNSVYGDQIFRLLHWACYYDALECAQVLINNGADLEAKTYYGASPLILAAEYASPSMEEVLLGSGAEVDAMDNNKRTALAYAASYCKPRNAEILVKYGADVNHASNNGWTPLMDASYNDCYQVARILLENGADVNAVKQFKETALMWSTKECGSSCLEVLLEYKPEIHAKCNWGGTALHWAAGYGCPQHAKVHPFYTVTYHSEHSRLSTRERQRLSKTWKARRPSI